MRFKNFLIFLLLFLRPACGQSVRLLPHAAVSSPVVQLGDIATIENLNGKPAEELSRTVILNNFSGSRTIKAEDILGAVIASGQRDLALQLQVCGAASCEVTWESGMPGHENSSGVTTLANQPVVVQSTPAVSVPHPAVVVETPVTSAVPAVIEVQTTTLAQQIQSQVYSELQCEPGDVRVTFETTSPFLDQPVPLTQRWQFRPMVKSLLGTVQWQAQLMEGTKTLQRLNVQAHVLKRAQVVVAQGPVQIGDIITAANVSTEDEWIDRKIPTQFARAQDVIGQQAQRLLAAGTALDQRDFRPVELVSRGDVTTIYLVSGGLKIKTSACALESGKLHDRIGFRNERTGEKMDATVIAKDTAAIGALDAKTESLLRETQ